MSHIREGLSDTPLSANGVRNDINEFFCAENCIGKDEALHRHDFFELIYVFSKSITANVNKDVYELNPGDLLVVLPGDTHSLICRKGCEYISIRSDVTFIFNGILTSSDLRFIKPSNLDKIKNARVFRNNKLRETEAVGINIPGLIFSIRDEYTDKKSFFKLAIRSNLSTVALFIFREWEKAQIIANNSIIPGDEFALKKLDNVIEIINERYMEELSAGELCKVAGMSYSYFSRFFKSAIGITFSEYLNSVRINASEKLLTQSDLSVAEVAERVGFANTSYYISQFKKQFHMTPKKYKATYGIFG